MSGIAWVLMALVIACEPSNGAGSTSEGDLQDVVTAQGDGSVRPSEEVGGEQPVDGDTYVTGLEKVGVSGVFTVKLLKSDPIPKYTGFYTWTLEVLDGDGQSVTGAAVVAEPTMPEHGHGTFPEFTTGTEASPGTYEFPDLDLFMDGVWHVAIRITNDLGAEDEVAYDFDLQG